MPDPTGKLTEEDKKKVALWLTRFRHQPPTCPFCNNANWIVGDYMVQPATLGAHLGVQFGGPGYPQVVLISKECGYTVYFNALLIGLVPRDLPDAKG